MMINIYYLNLNIIYSNSYIRPIWFKENESVAIPNRMRNKMPNILNNSHF
jgi:hypothetical protein